MRIYLYLLLFSMLPLFGAAQQRQLSGAVKSETGKAIAHAAVTVRNTAEQVVTYGMTSELGQFAFSIPDTAQLTALYLEVNMLGFKPAQQKLIAGQYSYQFVLKESVIELKEVKITNRPKLTSNGDTLSYDVNSFARPEDRNIGEVIARMPGLSVAENGEIYFNGKAISNMLTDGDNLMGGRYGLATKTITKDMIKSIEVIQHHQPIKVLKNRVYTDNVVVNLVLKDENSLKLSGQAMLGGGFPKQFDAAFNTIILSRKFKMLNALKSNNSGVDFRDEFTQYGSSGMLNNIGNTRPSGLLSAGTAGNPDLPRKNYYLNNSGVLNLNNLVNTKGGTQLRANIQAFVDKNRLNYESTVENYLDGNTIRFNELQRGNGQPFVLNAAITSMINKDNYYLDNSFKLSFAGEDKNSFMGLNNIAFNQQLRDRSYDISNDLSWVPAMKNKDVMEFRWYINYFNAPQRLDVDAGLNNAILNNGIPYQAMIQQAKTPTVFNHAYVTYRIGSKPISQSYQAGLMNERQQLNSTLSLVQTDNSVTDYTGDVGNDLHWQRDRGYINASYFIKKKTWDAGLSLPVAWQSIRYQQAEYQLDKTKSQFLFTPTLNFKLLLNAEDYITANYAYNTNVGNISGVYRGTVLSNYRSLRANNAELQEQYSSGTNFIYKFQRSIIMLFANAGISYNKVTANTILSSELTNNIQRTVLLPYENDQSSLMANAGVSKLIFALNTTFSMKASWSRSRFNQLINAQELPFNNYAWTFNTGIDSKIFSSLTMSYNGTGSWSKSKTEGIPNQLAYRTTRYDQSLNFGHSPFKSFFLNVMGRHVYSTQPGVNDINYLFLDTKMRYKLVKWRTDIEFDLTNILNVKYYEIFSLNANQSSANRYEIRGMMGILRATFAL